jgi:rod shape-determining protein MreD
MKLQTLIVAGIVAIVLQASLIPYLALSSITPQLPLLVVIFIGTRKGSYVGVLAGFVTGLVLDALSTGFLGLSSMTYSLVGFLSGKVFFWDVALPLGRWALASVVGVLFNCIIFTYVYTLGDAPPFSVMLLRQALPTAGYTWLVGMLWAISPLYERRVGMRLEG